MHFFCGIYIAPMMVMCTISELIIVVFSFQVDLSSGDFLQRKIREYFLENNHRLLLVMTPDVSLSNVAFKNTVFI